MRLNTRLTEMLDIRYPIIEGGMQNVGYASLAAAVSNADGLEASIHARVKQAYVANNERDTDLLFRPFRNSARMGRNAVLQEVLARTTAPGASFADVVELVSGQRGKPCSSPEKSITASIGQAWRRASFTTFHPARS